MLGAILDDAVEDELLESNPARGKRMRVRVPKPNRAFLETDELAALLEAASTQDQPTREAAPHPRLDGERAHHATAPPWCADRAEEAFLVPNARGGRSDRGRISAVLAKASAQATEQQLARGLPPLPNTRPHTLRRTYISIALLANNFDVKWVMAQVGHADSRMTMDVYAQLEQRVKREHGESFDRLMRQAGEIYGE